jgi:hypothetical protein
VAMCFLKPYKLFVFRKKVSDVVLLWFTTTLKNKHRCMKKKLFPRYKLF